VTGRAAAAVAAPAAGDRPRAALALQLAALAGGVGLVWAAARGVSPVTALAALALPLALVAFQRVLLAWQTLLGLILLVILFIPIRRYTVGGGLPIELEPYRVVIAVVLACWLCALAADPAVRWRRTALEAPILTFLLAILLSLAVNVGRVSAVSETVLKQVSFFVSFFLVTYFIASVIDRGPPLDRMLRVLVGGGTVVAVLSLVEWRTGTNMFDGLQRVLPFLEYVDDGAAMERGTGVRALGSAQHPIALGAALVMLVPLTVYLHRRDGRMAWLGAGALLTLGALATGSRTAAMMLIVLFVAFVWIKREETLRLAPMLLALLVVVQVAMPGTLGTFRAILNPVYVVEEQSKDMGTGSGRIADLGPGLAEWARKPLLGQGFGTRVTSQDGVEGGAQILDNQWLTSLLDVGAIGVLGLAWLFARAVRRLARRARAAPGADGWLATCLAASLAAFAAGMLTFDAFAFIQVTFFAFIMLGFAAVATREDSPPAR
jgi:hypothetical protein